MERKNRPKQCILAQKYALLLLEQQRWNNQYRNAIHALTTIIEASTLKIQTRRDNPNQREHCRYTIACTWAGPNVHCQKWQSLPLLHRRPTNEHLLLGILFKDLGVNFSTIEYTLKHFQLNLTKFDYLIQDSPLIMIEKLVVLGTRDRL